MGEIPSYHCDACKELHTGARHGWRISFVPRGDSVPDEAREIARRFGMSGVEYLAEVCEESRVGRELVTFFREQDRLRALASSATAHLYECDFCEGAVQGGVATKVWISRPNGEAPPPDVRVNRRLFICCPRCSFSDALDRLYEESRAAALKTARELVANCRRTEAVLDTDGALGLDEDDTGKL